jgi:hypothetical protein
MQVNLLTAGILAAARGDDDRPFVAPPVHETPSLSVSM